MTLWCKGSSQTFSSPENRRQATVQVERKTFHSAYGCPLTPVVTAQKRLSAKQGKPRFADAKPTQETVK